MSATSREIGTLVVVILKAQHLPNKQKIGKQDPYCSVTLNGDKRRTRAIKRGGQHPEWDEEVRFTLLEDIDDAPVRSNMNESANGSPPPPPQKESKRRKRIKGGNIMSIACYADDPAKPELIGETTVDLTEVLTKGETDDWFTLYNKDKFSGEVYLELTFWSNERPPEAKKVPKSSKMNRQYGGPGSYVPSNSEGGASQLVRSSSSLARLNLYIPPYESSNAKTIRGQQVGAMVDRATDEFGGLSLGPGRPQKRRESCPLQHSHTHPTGLNNPTLSSYSPSHNVESGSFQQHDSPTTPVPRQGRHSLGESTPTYAAYRSPYETFAPDHSSGYSPSQPSQPHSQSDFHSMYNLRSASTGFLPVDSAAIPTGTSIPTGQLISSNFVAPSQAGYPGNSPLQMPIPHNYGSSQAPASSDFSLQHSYHQSSVAPSYSAYQYGSAPIHSTLYQPPAPPMAPLASHPQQISSMSPVSQVPQQEFYSRGTPSPPQMPLQGYKPSPPNMASRPLPTPGVQNGHYATSTPPHSIVSTPPRGVSPSHGVFMHNNAAQTPPPAPPQTYAFHTPPGPQAQPVMTVGPAPVQPSQSSGFVPPPPPPSLNQPRAHGQLPPPSVPRHYQTQQQSIQSIEQQYGSINIHARPPLPQPPGGGSTLPLPPPPLTHHTTGFQPPPPPPPMLNRRSVSVSYTQSPYSQLPPPPMPPFQARGVKPGEIFNHRPPAQPPAQLSYESIAEYWSAEIH